MQASQPLVFERVLLYKSLVEMNLILFLFFMDAQHIEQHVNPYVTMETEVPK